MEAVRRWALALARGSVPVGIGLLLWVAVGAGEEQRQETLKVTTGPGGGRREAQARAVLRRCRFLAGAARGQPGAFGAAAAAERTGHGGAAGGGRDRRERGAAPGALAEVTSAPEQPHPTPLSTVTPPQPRNHQRGGRCCTRPPPDAFKPRPAHFRSRPFAPHFRRRHVAAGPSGGGGGPGAGEAAAGRVLELPHPERDGAALGRPLDLSGPAAQHEARRSPLHGRHRPDHLRHQ